MKTVLITGPTRGLGLAIAGALDRTGSVELVLAVRDVAAGQAVAAKLRGPARVVEVDMASLASIRRLASSWSAPLSALVNNAGLQLSGPTSLTEDGIETTLAVNHLGPLALALGLLPHLEGGRGLGIGSGTHNPENRSATMFGFRGGRFTSIEALARGEIDAANDVQRGMDRYATSKLVSMAATMELARRHPQITFATLDPGLMPGTGLARTRPWYMRALWSTVLRWRVPLLPDASTPARSAEAARRLLLEESPVSGQIYDFTAQPSKRVWPPARDEALGRRVMDESLTFLERCVT
jgi:NAD(P)-dependent dehydrogenase (short-subunit alcohol dehydrogenase family)